MTSTLDFISVPEEKTFFKAQIYKVAIECRKFAMGEAIADSESSVSIRAKDLPPPRISQEKIDGLLNALNADPIVDSDSSSTKQERLNGREILIPAYGGVAFYEGVLCPEIRKNSESKVKEDEEIVYVHTIETKTTKKQQQNPPNEKDVAVVGLSDAIEWLQSHSTSLKLSLQSQTLESKAKTSTMVDATKPLNDSGPSKPPPDTKQMPAPTSKLSLQKSRSRIPDYHPDQAPAGPMFNISEEYSADGTRIVGEAVNLSTRLKAVYGDDNPENFNQPRSEDSKIEDEDAPFDPTIGKEQEGKLDVPATAAISDEEYDRISKRLEELALMEEQEAKREKEGRRKPAKTLGGKVGANQSTQTKKYKAKSKSNSSFGFQKGFLNKKATKTKTTTKTNTQTNTKAMNAAKRDSKSQQSGVTIDVSQNKIHEIPREGRQQPVPSRKPSQQDQGHVPQPIHGSRLLDTSVFSGEIVERTIPKGSSSRLNSGVISRDVAARVAANEQTQSLQHELAQQQQQRQARPKRVSRFRQQRQEEQHHHHQQR